MHQTGALEEFQGPIDGRRLGGAAIIAEIRDQIIGFDRLAGRQQQLQDTPARRCQPFTARGQLGLGVVERARQLRLGQAALEVMIVGAIRSHPLELGPPAPDGKA